VRTHFITQGKRQWLVTPLISALIALVEFLLYSTYSKISEPPRCDVVPLYSIEITPQHHISLQYHQWVGSVR
jgi:hypothetical protein